LTNSFQAFAPAPPPNLEFLVWDFVADPPILDLFPSAGQQALMVIYDTPSKTNQLFSTTSPAAGTTWQSGVVTKMTNAFRIMAPMPATDPKRFFRAKRL
jgi:hypothetical protein